MNIKKYLKIWLNTTNLTLQTIISTRGASLVYIFGKFLRFFLFIAVLLIVLGRKENIAGYTFSDMILVFLVFNLFDLLGQFFFRGIYWFRRDIVSGDFDFTLLKPASPIFLVLTKWTDFVDLPLLLVVIYWLATKVSFFPIENIVQFSFLFCTGFLLILSVHILVGCLGVITTEVDHAILIYRDLSSMARVPVDIYTPFLRGLLIYILPIGVIFTFPAKALIGLLSWQSVVWALSISFIFLFASLKLWQFCLTKYSSASS